MRINKDSITRRVFTGLMLVCMAAPSSLQAGKPGSRKGWVQWLVVGVMTALVASSDALQAGAGAGGPGGAPLAPPEDPACGYRPAWFDEFHQLLERVQEDEDRALRAGPGYLKTPEERENLRLLSQRNAELMDLLLAPRNDGAPAAPMALPAPAGGGNDR